MTRNILTFLLVVITITASAQSKQLKKLYNKGKHKQAIALAEHELKTQPDNIALQFLFAKACSDHYDFEKAIPVFQKLESNSAVNAETKEMAKAYLGRCYYATGQEEKGLDILKACMQNKAARSAAKFANKELIFTQTESYYKNWEVKESKHIRFHFQDISVVENVEEYMQKQEQTAQRMCDFFKFVPGKKIDFFVWKSEGDAYKHLGESLAWSDAGYAIVNVLYNAKKEYELCHMLCRRIAKPKQTSMLISEGLGVYFEQMDKNLFKAARYLIPKDHFLVTELWEKPTQYTKDLSYPVGAALIEHLVNTGGKKKLLKLLSKQTIKHGKVVYEDWDRKISTFNALLMR